MASTETIMNMLERFSLVFDIKPSEMLIETWELALGEISDEVAQAATVHFIKTWGSNFNRKPRPGDIFDYQKELFEQQKMAAIQSRPALAAQFQDRDQRARAERNDPEAQAKVKAAIEEVKRLKVRAAS